MSSYLFYFTIFGIAKRLYKGAIVLKRLLIISSALSCLNGCIFKALSCHVNYDIYFMLSNTYFDLSVFMYLAFPVEWLQCHKEKNYIIE